MVRAALAALLLFAAGAWAQTTTVSGKLQTYSPNIAPNAVGNYVEFTLANCGNNTPQVGGTGVLLSRPVDFYPDATGALTAAANGGSTPALYGNDVISCGGAYTSRYAVRYYVAGIAQGPAKFYYVSSTVPFNLSTALPINLVPPLNPPYPNLTTCGAGQYTIGLNKDLSVNCVNLPSGASNAVVTNPTGTQYINQPTGTSFRPNELASLRFVDGLTYTTIQAAVTAAGTTGTVVIPGDYAAVDTWTNPSGVDVWDLRASGTLRYRQTLQLPAITSRLLKTDGSGNIVAATAGTDYSSPGTGVVSFNGRTNAVVPANGDYSFGLLSGTLGTGQVSGTYPMGITGNAGTASALAATPTQCVGGNYATGIAANGNANCAAAPSVGAVLESFDATGCTPTTSTDSSCSGFASLVTTMPDANYQPLIQVEESSGAFLYAVITSRTTTQINYTITCTFNCASINAPILHVLARHS